MPENVVTELSVIQKLSNAYTQGYKRNSNEYSLRSKERNDLSTNGSSTVEISKKMEEIKVRAQIYLYAVKLLSTCKTFQDLENARNNMMSSFNTFANKYRTGYDEYQKIKSTMTKTQSDSMVFELMQYYNKASFLRKVIEEINQSLTIKVSKEIVAPKVNVEITQEVKEQKITSPVRKPIESKQPTTKAKSPVKGLSNFPRGIDLSGVEVVKQLEAINKEIYATVLILGKLQFTQDEQYENVRMRVYQLGLERERIVAELTSDEIAKYILSDTSRKESDVLRAYGIIKPASYVLTKETYKERMEELSRILSDLKFNGTKSKTFKELHIEDHKTDTYTLSTDIMRFSNERRDIIQSVLGEDKEATEISSYISSLEAIYSLHESYASFKKQPGTLSGHERTRELFNGGRQTLQEKTDELNDLLEDKFDAGPITIESFSPTYESEKKKLEEEYIKIISRVLKYRSKNKEEGLSK